MVVKATIASGGSLSGILNIGDHRIAGIIMPAAWTAASLTFQVSADGTTFNDVYDEAGTEVSVVADASRYIGVDSGALQLSGLQFLKVRSGTSGTPVAQGGAREILLEVA